MKKEIVIYLPKVTETYFEVEGYAVGVCRSAQESGGRAVACWDGNGVKIRIQGLSRKTIHVFLDVLIYMVLAARGTLVIIEMLVDATPLPGHRGEITWGIVLLRPQRLTKRFASLLPDGAYLVSRRARNGRSVFSTMVKANREALWRRALASGAAGRSFYLAWSAPQFNEQRKLWIPILGPKTSVQ